MRNVYRTIEKIAQSDANGPISSERGAGKELVAQAIHANSSRKNRPFMAVNCGGIYRKFGGPRTVAEKMV